MRTLRTPTAVAAKGTPRWTRLRRLSICPIRSRFVLLARPRRASTGGLHLLARRGRASSRRGRVVVVVKANHGGRYEKNFRFCVTVINIKNHWRRGQHRSCHTCFPFHTLYGCRCRWKRAATLPLYACRCLCFRQALATLSACRCPCCPRLFPSRCASPNQNTDRGPHSSAEMTGTEEDDGKRTESRRHGFVLNKCSLERSIGVAERARLLPANAK